MLGNLFAIRGSLHRPHAQPVSGSTSGQDKHMLLPLAPVVGRIQVLPLSSRSYPQQHHKVGSPVSDMAKSTACCFVIRLILPSEQVTAVQDLALSSSLLQRISYFHHL